MLDVAKELDALCAQVAGCDLAVFTDIGSAMVLATSSGAALAQEDLDAVSEAAALVLPGAVGQGAARLANSDPSSAETAIVLTGQDARIYVRSTEVPNEAVVLICRPDTDLGAATDCARAAVAHIVASEV